MARKRMIVPDFWKSTFRWSTEQQLTFLCAITQADDEGKGRVRHVVAELRDKSWNVLEILRSLKEHEDALILYGPEEKLYFLPGWFRSQSVPKPTPSDFPNPPDLESLALQKHLDKYSGATEPLPESCQTTTSPLPLKETKETKETKEKKEVKEAKEAGSNGNGGGLKIVRSNNPGLIRAIVKQNEKVLIRSSAQDSPGIRRLFEALMNDQELAREPKKTLQYIWEARSGQNPAGKLVTLLTDPKYPPPDRTHDDAGRVLKRWEY